jgi:hypothetical protein
VQAVLVTPAAVGVLQLRPAGAEVMRPPALASTLLAFAVSTKVVTGAKLAVTLRAALIVRLQVAAVPVQAPLQPVNAEPEAALAVSFTTVPLVKFAEQLLEATPAAVGVLQAMPLGLEDTEPEAVVLPRLAVTVSDRGGRLKDAVTLRAALIDTWQVVAVPVQAPLQPVKVEPVAGLAVSVTAALNAKLALQVFVAPAVGVAQFTPVGEEVTVPEAVELPRSVVTLSPTWVGLKVAVTLRTADIATVQVVAVPLHDPPQPANAWPDCALAVSVTEVPLAIGTRQVLPQLMPPTFEVTVPPAGAAPSFVTRSA